MVIDQGSDYRLRIPILDDADHPVDVTGWSAVGQVRKDADSPLLHDLAVTPTGTVVLLHIPGSASDGWTWTRARYDVKLLDPNGVPTRLLEGTVKVRPAITRAG